MCRILREAYLFCFIYNNHKNISSAKNLKEIVDSVQEDLIKKLEEIQAEQAASSSRAEKHISID